jgi:hypothetical protein
LKERVEMGKENQNDIQKEAKKNLYTSAKPLERLKCLSKDHK